MTLTKGNFDTLLKYIQFETLPKTFEEAIYIARYVGFQYIWIDSLCLYLDRYRTKYQGKLRLGPLFSKGFRFMRLVYLDREISLCSFKNRDIIFQMAKLLYHLSTIKTGLLQVLRL